MCSDDTCITVSLYDCCTSSYSVVYLNENFSQFFGLKCWFLNEKAYTIKLMFHFLIFPHDMYYIFTVGLAQVAYNLYLVTILLFSMLWFYTGYFSDLVGHMM